MLEEFKKIHPIRYKYLFTVTSFSKYLALSMFIIFPIIGFYIGMKYQEKIQLVTTQSKKITFTIPTPELIGGSKDEFGCLVGAGYSWCEAKSKCLRVWEEPCIATASATATIDSSKWNTYKLLKVGLEFQAPANIFGKLTEEIKSVPTNNAGYKGEYYCAYIQQPNSEEPATRDGNYGSCHPKSNATLIFGSTSKDYVYGGSIGTSDFQGFIYSGGMYKAKFEDQLIDITGDTIKKVSNPNGVDILEILNTTTTHPLVEGNTAVIINTKNNIYTGIGFEFDKSAGIDIKTLEKILSSFKFTN